jgi:hypothetical protein
MDFLPIQASSVPCERIFSSAKETNTAKRNRISPILMEALQLLKFSIKKERLNFTAGWMTSEAEMKPTGRPASVRTKDLLGALITEDRNGQIVATDALLNLFADDDALDNGA